MREAELRGFGTENGGKFGGCHISNVPKGISSVAAAAKLCAVVRSSLVEMRGPDSLASSLFSDWSLCMTKEDLEQPLPIGNAPWEQTTTRTTKPDMKKNRGGVLGRGVRVEAVDGELEPKHNCI